jgi:ATP-dependent 26S proteasome regulatory subunit
MVVLEDVDLIAQGRGQPFQPTGPILFELLNKMDGLRDDCDVIFVLTTNRPDILEPALAARPGRIDLAIELPLPDADGRRAAFDSMRVDSNCATWTWIRWCSAVKGPVPRTSKSSCGTLPCWPRANTVDGSRAGTSTPPWIR